MLSPAVVVFHSGSDLGSCVGKVYEQGLVPSIVVHAAVKALDIAVLDKPAWNDVMPLHNDLTAPCESRIAGNLVDIVADVHAQLGPLDDHLRQFVHDTVHRD